MNPCQCLLLVLSLTAYPALSQGPTAKPFPASLFGYPGKLTASSHLDNTQTNQYDPSQAVDGKPFTAWIEGKDGVGVGERLTFEFGARVPVYAVLWIPGYAKSYKTLRGNTVPTADLNIDRKRHSLGRPILEHTFFTMDSGPSMGDPIRIPTDREEHFGPRYLLLAPNTKAKSISLALTGAVSDTGMDTDSGISEFGIVTDKTLLSDPVAFFLVQLRAKELDASLSALPVEHPKQGYCAGETKKAENSEAGAPPQSKPLNQWTGQDLLQALHEHLRTDRFNNNPPHLEAVYAIKNGVDHTLVFDHNLSEGCYMDGEGGTQFLPALVFMNNKPTTFRIIPGNWPVP